MREDGRFEGGFVESHLDVENVFHSGFYAASGSHTCGDIMAEMMGRAIRQVIGGQRGESLKVLHLHFDVQDGTVRTKDEKTDGRTARRVGLLVL